MLKQKIACFIYPEIFTSYKELDKSFQDLNAKLMRLRKSKKIVIVKPYVRIHGLDQYKKNNVAILSEVPVHIDDVQLSELGLYSGCAHLHGKVEVKKSLTIK